MLKQNHGALPTSKKTLSSKDALKHQLFSHYLSHRYKDIPNAKSNSSKKVIEGIIEKFGKKYTPEKYFRNSDGGKDKIYGDTIDDSLEDIRSVAHIAVWEAAHTYVWGTDKKVNNKIIHINYNVRFDFCKFASTQVKFKLRTHFRHLNLDRICGYAPDSDDIRKAYTKLPKIKFKKGNIDKKDYSDLAKETKNLDIKGVKALDKLITCRTVSGDEEKEDEDGNTVSNWNYLASKKSNGTPDYTHQLTEDNLEETAENNFINKEFHKIRNCFLNTLSQREKEILYHTKFKEINNLSNTLTLDQLGKMFNISGERVRKISEKKFEEFINIIKKNKKRLGR